jgi:hypothetical protein
MNPFCKVKSATYGIFNGDKPDPARSIDVTQRLQEQIDAHDGVVAITNDVMGHDPAYGMGKQLHVTVTVNGKDYGLSGRENDRIDFTTVAQPGFGMLFGAKNIHG